MSRAEEPSSSLAKTGFQHSLLRKIDINFLLVLENWVDNSESCHEVSDCIAEILKRLKTSLLEILGLILEVKPVQCTALN